MVPWDWHRGRRLAGGRNKEAEMTAKKRALCKAKPFALSLSKSCSSYDEKSRASTFKRATHLA